MSAALSYSFPGVRRAAPLRSANIAAPIDSWRECNLYVLFFRRVCDFSFFFFFPFFFVLFLTEIRYKRQFPGYQDRPLPYVSRV